MSHIEATALTTFEVASDGTRFRLYVSVDGGQVSSVSLPTECLTKLMMTLPDILRRALWNQFRDSSLRLVFPIGQTTIEKMAGKNTVILTSATPDGFEVSFEYDHQQVAALSRAIAGIASSGGDLRTIARRLD